MKIAFLGNFSVHYTTESHWAGSFSLLGHDVTRIQEGAVRALDVPALVDGHDLFIWVQTYGLAEQGGTNEERFGMLDKIHGMGIPSVGLHLDIWWGLDREGQVRDQAWFRMNHVFTAGGSHDAQFAAEGINHHWLPPGVYAPECVLGTPQPEYSRYQIAFVGSWRGHYHREWRHRQDLVHFLRRTYRGLVGFYPQNGAVRGWDLNNLYASIPVIIGDSCLVGGAIRYSSDRIPETLGRGGFLIHPDVREVTDGSLYTSGVHLATWPLGDWPALRRTIDRYLRDDSPREEIRLAGHEHTKANHTYTHRAQYVLDYLKEHG